jgi:hypothetical protein
VDASVIDCCAFANQLPAIFGGHDVAVVLSLDGSTTVVSKQDVATLDHGDAAILLRERDTCFRIAPAAANDCYLMLLLKHRAG